MPAIVY